MTSPFDDLNDENILLYAIKAYERPICIMSEFESDFKRVKYIKRLFGRFRASGDLKERNILNHIIVFYNVFGIPAATRLLFFKIDERDHDLLKTFLVYLSFMPSEVQGIKGRDIQSFDIPIDINILDRLGKVIGQQPTNVTTPSTNNQAV
jgi:hypothetical protein